MIAEFIVLGSFVIIAGMLIMAGLIIWKKQKIELIHEYHWNGVKDIQGYCTAMGKMIIDFGIFMLMIGSSIVIVCHMNIRSYLGIGIIIGVLVMGIIIMSIYVSKIYKKHS